MDISQNTKRITAAIAAHVDSGKTTLSEALLYTAGEIRKLGRVDNKDAFLDTDTIERERGITIFSKQAQIKFNNTQITLLDTPGHTDFAAEAERALGIADYAILVISASDGVQSHTQTLWKMLQKNNVPVFIFVNKLDIAYTEKAEIMNNLCGKLSDACVDFCTDDKDDKDDKGGKKAFFENIAVHDEQLMKQYFESNESISDESIAKAIAERKIFPCYFGSALKLDGVRKFLNGFDRYTVNPYAKAKDVLGARVFKIASDGKNRRLTFLKITSGSIAVKDILGKKNEKINEIRIYSGAKYVSQNTAYAGDVCAVTGISSLNAGDGIGIQKDAENLLSTPLFNYRVDIYDNTDINTVYNNFKILEAQDPQLGVEFNNASGEINLRLMGKIQLEILQRIMHARFNISVGFSRGSIIYKETIKNTVEGVGHFEPLKHYAEVHLLIEPLKRGSGVEICADCPEDMLAKNYQNLILTHLHEKKHLGVLTGSPVTDIKITLKAGRAHTKHTEGGDFREATYRAVRQGLMSAESILLEPYYDFTLEIPSDCVGRAMTDLNAMSAKFSQPDICGETACIKGRAAVRALEDYRENVISYTRGKGILNLSFACYDECLNSAEVIEGIGYISENDTQNPADSVFCSHGAGYTVKWNEVPEHMHLESILKKAEDNGSQNSAFEKGGISATDEELLKIYERTYGEIKNKTYTPLNTPKYKPYKGKEPSAAPNKGEYLLVDGYNIIFAWDGLNKTARESLDSSRVELINRMINYRIFKKCEIIIVFDAYKVKGNTGEINRCADGVTVVYTKEAETADSYIEKCAHTLAKDNKVCVATSDALEQMIIFGSGAQRISARMLQDEVLQCEKEIDRIVEKYHIEAQKEEFVKYIKI